MRNRSRGSVAGVVLIVLAVFAGISVIGYAAGWFGEAAQVTQEQFGPRAMLKKYEWFKDASAQLDAKRANIVAAQARMKGMEEMYKSTARTQWPREDREQYNLWSSEVAGLIASYNGLAAEYNAQMAKANWSFANAGSLPAGASTPLPRDYKPYDAGGAQ